jgi:hypothetical protein
MGGEARSFAMTPAYKIVERRELNDESRPVSFEAALRQMKPPKNSELVEARDIRDGDSLWAMSRGSFKVRFVVIGNDEVVLYSQTFHKEDRGQLMRLLPTTKLVRVNESRKSERVGGGAGP